MSHDWINDFRERFDLTYGLNVLCYKSQNTGETVEHLVNVSMNHGKMVALSLSFDRYDTQGSDAEYTKNERNSGTPLGDALFELLTLKFSWEANQIRRKNEK